MIYFLDIYSWLRGACLLLSIVTMVLCLYALLSSELKRSWMLFGLSIITIFVFVFSPSKDYLVSKLSPQAFNQYCHSNLLDTGCKVGVSAFVFDKMNKYEYQIMACQNVKRCDFKALKKAGIELNQAMGWNN